MAEAEKQISIPFGAIKRNGDSIEHLIEQIFQFLLVRLKAFLFLF